MPEENKGKYRINLKKDGESQVENEIVVVNTEKIESKQFQHIENNNSVKIDQREFNEEITKKAFITFIVLVLIIYAISYVTYNDRRNNNQETSTNTSSSEYLENINVNAYIQNENGNIVVENLTVEETSKGYFKTYGTVENKSKDIKYDSVSMEVFYYDEYREVVSSEICFIVDNDGIMPNETLNFSSYSSVSGDPVSFEAKILENYDSEILTTEENNKNGQGKVQNQNGDLVIETVEVTKNFENFYSVIGTVKNYSNDTKYSDVSIKILYYDENGEMLTSDSCFIVDYNGIMPNETLQFEYSSSVDVNPVGFKVEILEDYKFEKVSTTESSSKSTNSDTVQNANGDIVVEGLSISKVFDDYYSIEGSVKNTSEDIKYENVVLKITFYDENGEMLTADRCYIVDYNGILPNERLQFESASSVAGNPTSYELEILDGYKFKKVSTTSNTSKSSNTDTVQNANGDIVVKNLNISQVYDGYYSVKGSVKNTSEDTIYKNLVMKITYYDENGEMLTADRCYIVDYNGIMPNETLQFESINSVSGNIASYELEVLED